MKFKFIFVLLIVLSSCSKNQGTKETIIIKEVQTPTPSSSNETTNSNSNTNASNSSASTSTTSTTPTTTPTVTVTPSPSPTKTITPELIEKKSIGTTKNIPMFLYVNSSEYGILGNQYYSETGINLKGIVDTFLISLNYSTSILTKKNNGQANYTTQVRSSSSDGIQSYICVEKINPQSSNPYSSVEISQFNINGYSAIKSIKNASCGDVKIRNGKLNIQLYTFPGSDINPSKDSFGYYSLLLKYDPINTSWKTIELEYSNNNLPTGIRKIELDSNDNIYYLKNDNLISFNSNLSSSNPLSLNYKNVGLSFNSSKGEGITNLALGNNNDLYFMGKISSSVFNSKSSAGLDTFVAKLSINDNSISWGKQFGSLVDNYPIALFVDSNKNIMAFYNSQSDTSVTSNIVTLNVDDGNIFSNKSLDQTRIKDVTFFNDSYYLLKISGESNYAIDVTRYRPER